MKKEQVRVDIGYDLCENSVVATVIERLFVQELFSDELKENLLVEIPGGERIWVDSWESKI